MWSESGVRSGVLATVRGAEGRNIIRLLRFLLLPRLDSELTLTGLSPPLLPLLVRARLRGGVALLSSTSNVSYSESGLREVRLREIEERETGVLLAREADGRAAVARAVVAAAGAATVPTVPFLLPVLLFLTAPALSRLMLAATLAALACCRVESRSMFAAATCAAAREVVRVDMMLSEMNGRKKSETSDGGSVQRTIGTGCNQQQVQRAQ